MSLTERQLDLVRFIEEMKSGSGVQLDERDLRIAFNTIDDLFTALCERTEYTCFSLEFGYFWNPLWRWFVVFRLPKPAASVEDGVPYVVSKYRSEFIWLSNRYYLKVT